MRKIYFIILLGFFFYGSKAQDFYRTDLQKNNVDTLARNMRRAGTELKTFTRTYYTGFILEFTGAVLITINAANSQSSTSGQGSTTPVVGALGGGLIFIGLIFTVVSFSSIGAAGRYLHGDKVSLLLNEQGVGMSYSLIKNRKKTSSTFAKR